MTKPIKYRFTIITETYTVREITEDEKRKLKELNERGLTEGSKLVEFKIEKLSDQGNDNTNNNTREPDQSITVSPKTSISERLSKL